MAVHSCASLGYGLSTGVVDGGGGVLCIMHCMVALINVATAKSAMSLALGQAHPWQQHPCCQQQVFEGDS